MPNSNKKSAIEKSKNVDKKCGNIIFCFTANK